MKLNKLRIFSTTLLGTALFSFSSQVTAQCTSIDVPYFENFNATSNEAIPSCTSTQFADYSTDWWTEDGSNNPYAINAGFDGTVLTHYQPTGTNNAWFFTPGINFVAGTSYRLKFKAGAEFDMFPHSVSVKFGNSADSATMTHLIIDLPLIASGKNEFSVDFIAPTTEVDYVGFHVYSVDVQGGLYLDDISVDVTPACSEPEDATSSMMTGTTAVVSWNASISNPEIVCIVIF